MNKEQQQEFMQYYDEVHRKLSVYCRSITGNSSDARDLMSETIAIACQNFEKLRDKNAFAAWLFGIAANVQKHSYRRKKYSAELNENEVNKIAGNDNPEHATELKLVYAQINLLPENQREALIMADVLDFSLAEIQKVQGGSLSAIKSRVTRARERLSKLLRINQKPR